MSDSLILRTLCCDLLRLIGDKCDHRTLFNLRISCRAFYGLFSDRRFFPTRLLATMDVPPVYISAVMKNANRLSALTELVLYHCIPDPTCSHSSCHQTDPQHASSYIDNQYIKLLSLIGRGQTNITHLMIPICALYTTHIMYSLIDMAMFAQITRLSVHMSCNTGASLEFLSMFPALTHLSLLRYNVGAPPRDTIAEKRGKFPCLEKLDIEVLGVYGLENSTDIRVLLRRCTNLKRLRLRVLKKFMLMDDIVDIVSAVRKKHIPLFQICGVTDGKDDAMQTCGYVQIRDYCFGKTKHESPAALLGALEAEFFVWHNASLCKQGRHCAHAALSSFTDNRVDDTAEHRKISRDGAEVFYQRAALPADVLHDPFYASPLTELICYRLETSNYATVKRARSETPESKTRCSCIAM
jgi:hypothetical protein